MRAPSVASNTLVKRSKDGDAGYNYIIEADELEKILGLSRYDGEDRELEARRGVIWGATMPVESIAIHGSGHLKLTGSLGEVRAELIRAISSN